MARAPYAVSRKLQTPPPLAPAAPIVDTKPIPTYNNALCQMSDEEIEQENRALLEQLDGGTGQLYERVQGARWGEEKT